MPQFDISTYSSQLFWLVVCWGLLFLYLWLYLVPKMQMKLKNRDKKIEELLQKAKALDENAEQLLWEYKAKKQAYKETQNAKMQKTQTFIEQSKLDLEADFKQKLDSATQELESKLKIEHAKALANFPQEISVALSKFAMQYGLDAADASELLEKRIKKEIKDRGE